MMPIRPSRWNAASRGSIRAVRRLFADERGATAIEYGLIAALIAVAILASLTLLSDSTNAMFDYVSDRVVPALSQPE